MSCVVKADGSVYGSWFMLADMCFVSPQPCAWDNASSLALCCETITGSDTPGAVELAQWFDGLNDTPAWRQLLSERHGCDVIALAHFLPHQVCCERGFPACSVAVGSGCRLLASCDAVC
jgi:hypothetical protein